MSRSKTYIGYQSYCVRISDWSLTYGLSLGASSTEGQPYSEYVSLIISGTFLVPKRLNSMPVEITLLADKDMSRSLAGAPIHYTPKSIGQLTVRGQRREFLGSIPSDSVSLLASGLAAKRLKFIVLNGAALKYGSASITSMHWYRQLDPDEYE